MANSLSGVVVGPKVKKPTHDVKLTDINGSQLGLILCDSRGKLDSRNLRIAAMPRTPLQTSQGGTGYDDLELPFVSEVQQTWIGGRGQIDFSDDRTKFDDSYRMDTTREFPVCGPHSTWQTGLGVEHLNLDIQSPIDGSFAVGTASNYFNFRVRIISTGTITSVSMRMANADVARTFDYSLNLTAGGGALAAPVSLNFTQYSFGADEDEEAYVIFPCSINATKGQDLHITVGNFSGNMTIFFSYTCEDILETEHVGDHNEEFLIYTEAGDMIIASEDESPDKIEEYTTAWGTKEEWGSIFGSIIYGTNNYMRMFEYKHQVYCIVNDADEDQAPKLYINGYRGVAKSNAGNLFQTRTGLSLATNVLKDKIIMIYNGPGEMELQPWRKITRNTASTINVENSWNVKQTTSTEFVILGMDLWTEITGHGLTAPVTDVEIVKNYVIFAQGKKAPIRFMREYNNSGTWTRQFAAHAQNGGPGGNEYIYADMLEVGQLLTGEEVLWRARRDDCLVDYSFVGDWDATGTPLTGTMLFFDVNKNERADLSLQKTRLEADKTTEEAKPPDEQDEGYITSLTRAIQDIGRQITETAGYERLFLPYYIKCGDTRSKITGLLMYGQPPIPYILKEDSIGSIHNNIYAEIPIPEMKWARAENNGKANMQQGVYLYFNLVGGMIERYYEMHLDDVGPTGGEGLPRSRQGEISCLMPYPGRYYAGINAGTSGYSSLLCHNGVGWHEIYRSNTIGKMISAMYVQVMPGFDNADRLFVSEGTGLLSMPIVINPTKQYDYEFFGYEETGNIVPYVDLSWMDFGLKDVNKYFHSATIFSDSTDGAILKGTEYFTYVYYKIDNQKTWKMAGKGGAYAAQEILLSRAYLLSGKRIKIRIAMHSNTEQTETPRLKAVVVKAVLRLPVKRSWSATFLLEPMKDLQDRPLTDSAGLVYDQLFTWANSDTYAPPLLMNANDSITDGKRVFIDPASISTFQAASQMEPGSGHKEYKHIGQITIYEA